MKAEDVTVAEGVDGVSVAPLLKGEEWEAGERLLYWEFFEGGFQQAARWGDWKVIRPKAGAALQLYDLREDVGEKVDVAKKHPEVVRMLEEKGNGARRASVHWPTALDE